MKLVHLVGFITKKNDDDDNNTENFPSDQLSSQEG